MPTAVAGAWPPLTMCPIARPAGARQSGTVSSQRLSIEKIYDVFKELFPQAYVCRMSQLGLQSPNDFAIGIVVQPGPYTTVEKALALITHPASIANWWGHTALYVRENGRITRAIGFDPYRLKMALPGNLAVASGTLVTQGYYFDEDKMFNSPDVMCVEFRASPRLIRKLLKKVPSPGEGTRKQLQKLYATHDGVKLPGAGIAYDPTDMGNCINFINTVFKKTGIRMVNLSTGIAFDSAQWRLTQAIRNKQVGFRCSGDIRTDNPTYLSMPRAYQLSRRAGGALRTVSVARLVLTVVRSLMAAASLVEAPDWVWSDTAFFLVWLLGILQETIPESSWFWKLQPAAFDLLLTTGATLAWMYQITSNPAAWCLILAAYAMMLGVASQLS